MQSGYPRRPGRASRVALTAPPDQLKQQGFLRKFFITHSAPGMPVPRIASAEGGVVVFTSQAMETGLARQDETIGGGTQRDNLVMTNDFGNMTVGMWETTAFESAMQPFSVHEFAHIVEGEVTIVETDGTRHHFSAGDAFFVSQGSVQAQQPPAAEVLRHRRP